MAHKKSKKDQREVPYFANPVADPPVPRTVRQYLPENFYSEVEDNRRWHPEPPARGKTVSGGRPRIVVKRGPNGRPLKSKIKYLTPSAAASSVTSRLGYAVPRNIISCIRRAMRREIIFALKKQKKGAGARRRRRNEKSNIDC